MSYQILKSINTILQDNESFIQNLKKLSKEDFSNNEDFINICIGIANEINKLINSLNDELFMLNKDFFDVIQPIKIYTNNLFTNYKIPNAYKLYDLFVVDFPKLKRFLDSKGE